MQPPPPTQRSQSGTVRGAWTPALTSPATSPPLTILHKARRPVRAHAQLRPGLPPGGRHRAQATILHKARRPVRAHAQLRPGLLPGGRPQVQAMDPAAGSTPTVTALSARQPQQHLYGGMIPASAAATPTAPCRSSSAAGVRITGTCHACRSSSPLPPLPASPGCALSAWRITSLPLLPLRTTSSLRSRTASTSQTAMPCSTRRPP